jgi:DNA (cytosine-5)-methyltransferase 1
MTKYSRLSRFGMMFKPLTESHGKELLMSYLEDFHAKTLAQQEQEVELKVNDLDCGEKWHGSFTKLDQDTLLWKTHQCSLLEDLELFSQTWPESGTMLNGECWERQTLELDTKETEFGSLPNGVDFFHTPNTTGLDGGSNSRKALKKRMEQWPTPQASDNRDRGNISSPSVKRRIQIGKQISLGQSVSETSGKLNPMWVEWLMGWPMQWTDLKPLEMDKYLYVQQQLGNY